MNLDKTKNSATPTQPKTRKHPTTKPSHKPSLKPDPKQRSIKDPHKSHLTLCQLSLSQPQPATLTHSQPETPTKTPTHRKNLHQQVHTKRRNLNPKMHTTHLATLTRTHEHSSNVAYSQPQTQKSLHPHQWTCTQIPLHLTISHTHFSLTLTSHTQFSLTSHTQLSPTTVSLIYLSSSNNTILRHLFHSFTLQGSSRQPQNHTTPKPVANCRNAGTAEGSLRDRREGRGREFHRRRLGTVQLHQLSTRRPHRSRGREKDRDRQTAHE